MRLSAQFIAVAVSPLQGDASSFVSDNHQWLDRAEKARCAEFKLPADRAQFIASRVLLRQLLSHYTYLPPSYWQFEHLSTGQWKLKNSSHQPQFHISTSHCSTAVAVAISETLPIGIDIESLAAFKTEFSIAGALHPSEWDGLPKQNSKNFLTQMAQLWTAKEAYSKLCGMGTELDFNSFAIQLEPMKLRVAPAAELDSAKIEFRSIRPQLQGMPHQLNIAYRNLTGLDTEVRIHTEFGNKEMVTLNHELTTLRSQRSPIYRSKYGAA